MFGWLARVWRRVARSDSEPGRGGGPAVGVVEDGGLVTWRRVARLEEAGPGDRVYAVDPATGSVVFGDGVHGRRPGPGQVVRVRPGAGGAVGRLGDLAVRLIEFEFPFEPAFNWGTPPGRIHQIMPAGGWMLVEEVAGGERLTPLVGWALLDAYVPPYQSGGDPIIPRHQSVRGLIATAGGSVRIVDELAANFAGYRGA